jgi:hypothetical protein
MPLELLKNVKAASSLLMVYPRNFYANHQTLSDNLFQSDKANTHSKKQAQIEFENLLGLLQKNGIETLVYKATDNNDCPDELFPNNWISTHTNGALCLYPMKAENRRLERRLAVIDFLKQHRFQITEMIDFSEFEKVEIYCEGTGSLLFDHYNKIAFAAISERTHPLMVEKVCEKLGYKSVLFETEMQLNNKSATVYHTNTLLYFAGNIPVFCADVIKNSTDFIECIQGIYPIYITLSIEQFESFAANTLHVQNQEGTNFLVMSTKAYQSLGEIENMLTKLGFQLLHAPLTCIENLGGGSARCMLAEVFLPKAL